MKFISKHSPGPWANNNGCIMDADNNPIEFITWDTEIKRNDHDKALIVSSPEMLDYLIERATLLSDYIETLVVRNKDGKIIECDDPFRMVNIKIDLDEIIELIKKAGVEVVE